VLGITNEADKDNSCAEGIPIDVWEDDGAKGGGTIALGGAVGGSKGLKAPVRSRNSHILAVLCVSILSISLASRFRKRPPRFAYSHRIASLIAR